MLGPQWNQKPPVGTPIDPAASLAQGMVAFWPMWEGSGCPVDVATGRIAAGNTAPWVGSPNGVALSGATNQFVDLGWNTDWLNVTGPITIATLARPLAGANGQALYGTGNASNAFVVNNYSGTQLLYSTGSEAHGVPAPDSGGAWHTFALSQSGSTVTFYLDGDAVGAASFGSYANSFTGQRALMADTSGFSALIGPMSWFGIWSRALLPAEHLMLTGNPWQLFRPRRDVVRLSAAGSGSGVSYPRGSSIFRPVQIPAADLSCYLD